MIRRRRFWDNKEEGFVLVAALSFLVVLTLLGIAALNTAFIEKNISQNINLAEKTFYGADGGTEIGIEMIEWNVACPLGFNRAGLTAPYDPSVFYDIGGIRVADPKFAHREKFTELPWDPVKIGLPAGTAITVNDFPSDGARNISIPVNMVNKSDKAPHTNLAIMGVTGLAAGESVVVAGGDDGSHKNIADGGGVIRYQVFSQKVGILNSVAVIQLRWMHLLGKTGECRPY